jgi:DNA-binding transcriptional MerR regulator
MQDAGFSLTLGDFCRAVPCSRPTGRLYADLQLVPAIRDSSGRRLFSRDAIEVARRVLAERTGHRVA